MHFLFVVSFIMSQCEPGNLTDQRQHVTDNLRCKLELKRKHWTVGLRCVCESVGHLLHWRPVQGVFDDCWDRCQHPP